MTLNRFFKMDSIGAAVKVLLLHAVTCIVVIVLAAVHARYIIMGLGAVAMIVGWKAMLRLGHMAFEGDWEGTIDLSQVEIKMVEIPRRAPRDGVLHAAIYRDRAMLHHDPSDVGVACKPYVIVAHGAQNSFKKVEFISVCLVKAGYNVLAFNQSGHGAAPYRSDGDSTRYTEVMIDIHDVVPFVQGLPDIARKPVTQGSEGMHSGDPLIGFVGHSTGGLMALSQAYLNPGIQVTVGMSGICDFMRVSHADFPRFSKEWAFKVGLKHSGMVIEYSDEENHIISPKYCLKHDPEANLHRVFMVHAEDDPLPISEMRENRQIAGIPDENCLFLKRGGHGLRSQETMVMGQVIGWLNANLV